MRVLFICGSLEPGKDGVGDYTRILAYLLICQGFDVKIVALYDKNTDTLNIEDQAYNGKSISCIRLSRNESFKFRKKALQNTFFDYKPDWCSLQYVPYSFHNKGIPLALSALLKPLRTSVKWHIMFHELRLAIQEDANLKDILIGYLQQKIYTNLINVLSPDLITTQSRLYQNILKHLNRKIYLLELFSNIEVVSPSYRDSPREAYLKVAVFGGIQEDAYIVEFINWLKLRTDKKLKFIFIGNNGKRKPIWLRHLSKNKVEYSCTGFLQDNEISQVLSTCDIGVSTTPYLTSDKSGSVAAMFTHKLPIYSIARRWNVKGISRQIISLDNIYEWKPDSDLHLNFKKKSTHFKRKDVVLRMAELYNVK